MKLNRLTPAQQIEIRQPRWHDRVVMIAKFRVGVHNIITFTGAKSLPDEYYLDGKTISKYPLESNGKLMCFAVPLDEMQLFEGRE